MSTNQKFNDAKERLITSAQRVAGAYLLSRYGSAHLIGEPLVELTSIVDPDSSSLLFNGKITVSADSGAVLNPVVGVEMTVNSNEIEVDSETSIQSKIESAVNAQQQVEPVKASLGGFKLVDDGTMYLKVSHTALQDSKLGIIGKNEYATSKDRAALLQGMFKDAVLNTPVEFTGEFKEPTIEKPIIVKQASKYPCDVCKEVADLKDGQCAKCLKALDDEKPAAKKSSWLTADLFKEATVEKKADDDDYCSECEKPLQFGGVCESCKRDLENDAEASLNTVAIKKDMPMARAHDSMAHMAQSEDQSMLEAQIKVEHEAANQLMSLLQGMGYGSAKTVEITSSKEGLDIMTAIDDGGAVKAVSIPVSVKEGKVILPKKALVATLIARGLDVQAKLAEQFDLETLEKLATIEERMAYEAAEANAILNEKIASIEKIAVGEKQPFFDSDDSTMTVQKHLLPNHSDLKKGDRLNDGVDDWEIVNTEGQQNDKNEGSSSQWTLKKVQGPERDGKKPSNKIPS